jgi:hypothetical protein
MSFRDIKKFNLAMLGKQGWHLMSNPSSLCARVLKGKYYPNGEFMTTNKNKHASHTWRAILKGRSVLEMGLIHHIGNVTSTSIWNDKWIPNGVGMKPICRAQGATATQVSELLDQSGSWDEEALSANLIPMDARAVRCIPLGRTEDFCAWTGEKHGNYSVKSAYMLLMEKANQDEEHFQDKPSHSDAKNSWIWRKLWRCKVPPKVRVFWWRVYNEFITSRANLHHRHIELLDTCVTCGA